MARDEDLPDEPEDVDELEAIRATDRELDDIGSGGTGSGDRVAERLVAWRNVSRGHGSEEVGVTEPDWMTVELADLHVRELPDGKLFIAITSTPLEATPEDLIAGRDMLRGEVKGIILDSTQRRALAERIAPP